MEGMTKDFQYLEKVIKENHPKFKEEMKRNFSLPQQHRPESLLSGVGTPLMGRKGTLHEVTCGFMCMNVKRHEEVGWKTHFFPSSKST